MNHAQWGALRQEALVICSGLLTVPKAERVVEIIRELREDDELAHALEDALRQAALATIALQITLVATDRHEVKELARAALSTKDIEFSRWTA